MIQAKKEPTCCDDENNEFVRETDMGICPRCKEHSGEIACKVCDEMIFESECCG